MKGSEMIIETLASKGINTSFGITGGYVIPLFDALMNNSDRFRNIHVRHEQAAAHAADGYARATGKVGVCIATSGPGATNLVTGIATAFMDSVPILAFGGQVPTSLIGNDAFQESDMVGITMPITKHNFQLRRAQDVSPMIIKALKIASTGRPGPVYIDLTKDAQIGEASKNVAKDMPIQGFQPNIKGNPKQIKAAAELIMKAERPVFLVGGGVILSNSSPELAKLVDFVKAPVATTLMGKGAFPENHPLSIGMVGMHGKRIANYSMINSDLIITIGCRFSDRITGNLKTFVAKAKLIHIDIDPAEIGKIVGIDVPIVGDAKGILTELLIVLKKMAVKPGNHSEWNKRMIELNKMCDCLRDENKSHITPRKLLVELRKAIGEKDLIVTGVGQHQMFAAHFLNRVHPRTFITSGGLGTMGFGLPAAMGASVARPDVNVYNLEGDGSFAMNSQELATLKENGIKVISTIFNNAYLGMVRQWLEIFFDKRYSNVHLGKNPDFSKLAGAYSLEGISVEKPSEIAEALKRAAKSDESTVLDIHIEQESNILPMLPPGGNLEDFFGPCVTKKGSLF